MNESDNLRKLYNTLLLIETKGESTKIMADCLIFVEEMMKKAIEKESDSIGG